MNHVEGPDKRKWRVVEKATCCKYCGEKPIAARSGQFGVGWNLTCRNSDKTHSHIGNFEQWLSKCVRKWDIINSNKSEV